MIAFTARALDSEEKSGPKYMNSPETPLYSKGQVLFNLDKARQAIRQQDFALLVEGQMDCITAYMAGIQNVLATSGTAFTEMQVRLLSRYTKRLFVNFDPDAAGANAAEKSIALLTEEDFEVRVVTLEGGLDPDRFIRERGIKDYVAAVKAAKRHSDYLIDRAMQLFPSRTAEGKSKALNYLLPHIRRMPNRIVRDEFAADAAQKLGIDSALVGKNCGRRRAPAGTRSAPSSMESMNEAERLLLRAVASPSRKPRFPACFRGLAQPAGVIRRSRRDHDARAFARSGARWSRWPRCRMPGQRALLAQVLLRESEAVEVEQVEAALESLKYRHLEALQRRVRADIAEAERRGDLAQLAVFMAEKLKVDREMRDVDRFSPGGETESAISHLIR